MNYVRGFLVTLLLVSSGSALGQRALELEQQIPDWKGGRMTLYFNLALFPKVQADGSFSFAKSTAEITEDIEFWSEHSRRYRFEDLYTACFDDAADAPEFSTNEASYWLFKDARLNLRSDGTHDGTVELKAKNGTTFTFLYADRPVDVTGHCQVNQSTSIELDLELAPEVRYVKVEQLGEGRLRFTTDVSEEDIENAEWVFELN